MKNVALLECGVIDLARWKLIFRITAFRSLIISIGFCLVADSAAGQQTAPRFWPAIPAAPHKIAPPYRPDQIAPSFDSTDQSGGSSKTTGIQPLHAERFFDSNDALQLSRKLADVFTSEGFQVEQYDNKTVTASKYDSDKSEDHDKAELTLTSDADGRNGSIKVALSYSRYVRIITTNTGEYEISPTGESRKKFNQLIKDFDELEKTLIPATSK